ncbi:hypothetical protein LTS10_012680 [Elasticomyces elasticus]|nr:hypothetical protein LTS10_012680 [Elasticomyces elasticus]
MATIENGSTVLVTGANGYIASHVADQLLQKGFKVRGTVRSDAKAAWLYKLFDARYGKGKFEAVAVADMVADGAFDEAVKGVSGIVHVASILTFSDKYEEVVPPTVKGAVNIIASARKEPSVKSVVYTSSSTAAISPEPDKKVVVTKTTWNDAAVASARNDPNAGAVNIYAASKTEGERAIWAAVAEEKPSFQVSAVLPDANFGRILQPGAEESSSTGSWAVRLYQGDTSALASPPHWFVDVADTARLHVAALIDPSCDGQRVFAFAEPFNWNDLLGVFRKLRPGHTVMEDTKMGRNLSLVPNKDAEELLVKHFGKGWTSFEESISDNIATLA